jgi:hypothetical protein
MQTWDDGCSFLLKGGREGGVGDVECAVWVRVRVSVAQGGRVGIVRSHDAALTHPHNHPGIKVPTLLQENKGVLKRLMVLYCEIYGVVVEFWGTACVVDVLLDWVLAAAFTPDDIKSTFIMLSGTFTNIYMQQTYVCNGVVVQR